MLVILFVLTLLRGQGNVPSLIGVIRCDPLDWVLFGLLILLSIAITVVVLVKLRREYTEKKAAGYIFVVGDFKCTNEHAIRMPLTGLLCAFFAIMLGSGPGLFFIPVLVAIDLNP